MDSYIIKADLFLPGFSLFLMSPVKKHGLFGSSDGQKPMVCLGNRFLKGLAIWMLHNFQKSTFSTD